MPPFAAVARLAGDGSGRAATLDFPMENIGTDLATLCTTVAGNLFELGELYACRLNDVELPDEFVAAHPGPAFGIAGTRRLLGDARGALVGTIVKPKHRLVRS